MARHRTGVFRSKLMTFAEKFWWLWGKYVLVFLLISIFDFTPDLMAFVGYFIGFSLAMAAIVLDHFVWRYEKLSSARWHSSSSWKAATATLMLCAHFHCYLDMCFGLFIPI